MVQGAENDLIDIRFYFEITPVIFNRDNEPFEDANTNTLTVDNKAILARDTAIQAQIDLAAHIGQGGTSQHSGAATALSGFLPVADKSKLDAIQNSAQLNILAPVDAIELISRKSTTLHSHILATPLIDGFVSTVDKIKLDGIEASAQVNNLSVADATQLTSGGNADTLHTHNFVGTAETFTEAVHLTTDHTAIPGVGGFSGFTSSIYNLGTVQLFPGVTIFSNPYAVTTLYVVTAGIADIMEIGWWGKHEQFLLTDVSISGVNGIVTYEIKGGNAPGDTELLCWQGGYGQ